MPSIGASRVIEYYMRGVITKIEVPDQLFDHILLEELESEFARIPSEFQSRFIDLVTNILRHSDELIFIGPVMRNRA